MKLGTIIKKATPGPSIPSFMTQKAYSFPLWSEIVTSHGVFLVTPIIRKTKRSKTHPPYQECFSITIEPGTEREEMCWAIQVTK